MDFKCKINLFYYDLFILNRQYLHPVFKKNNQAINQIL